MEQNELIAQIEQMSDAELEKLAQALNRNGRLAITLLEMPAYQLFNTYSPSGSVGEKMIPIIIRQEEP